MALRLSSVLQRLAGRCGFEVRRLANTLGSVRMRLVDDLAVDLVLDVGGNVGSYARQLRSGGYAGPIVSFEPMADAFEALSAMAATDGAHVCYRLALGAEAAERSLHVARMRAASSLLLPSEAMSRCEPGLVPVAEETVSVIRLDDLDDRHIAQAERILLKIDVQGTELDVLAGAKTALARVVALEMEVSLREVYRGQQNGLCDVLRFLGDSGLQCVWIERGYQHPVTRHMVQADLLCVRTAA